MRVVVDTGSRLHLGFTDLSSDLGRTCGSIGVALDRPSTAVVLEESEQLRISGAGAEAIRAVVRRFSDAYGVEPRVSITVRERIPEHVGLGSGTQTALAVAAGLAVMCGIDADVRELARMLLRGRRSGIGIAAFHSGGLIIDAGAPSPGGAGTAVPTVVWRHDIPADWSFIVAIPVGIEGLSGHGEEGVFARLTSSVRTSEEISRLALLQLMPALSEGDIEAFGRALTAIDRKTGQYFADVQGGVYSHGDTGATIAEMLRMGALGAGQSSWGPTVYGLVPEADAAPLRAHMAAFFAERDMGEAVHVCHGRNTRARVDVSRGAS